MRMSHINYPFVLTLEDIQNILSKTLGIDFEDDSAVTKQILMRKEIVPTLKRSIENRT